MALYVYSNLIMTRVLGDFDTGKDMKAVGQGVYFFLFKRKPGKTPYEWYFRGGI